MGSLRNAFQTMHKEAPSGSEPIGRTKRQKEILRLVFFLRKHIKTTTSITSYKGASPAPSQKKAADKKHSTPIKPKPTATSPKYKVS